MPSPRAARSRRARRRRRRRVERRDVPAPPPIGRRRRLRLLLRPFSLARFGSFGGASDAPRRSSSAKSTRTRLRRRLLRQQRLRRALAVGVLLEVRQVVVGPLLHQLDRRLGVRARHSKRSRTTVGLSAFFDGSSISRHDAASSARQGAARGGRARRVAAAGAARLQAPTIARASATRSAAPSSGRHRRPQRGEEVEGERARRLAAVIPRAAPAPAARREPHCEAAAAARSAAPAAPLAEELDERAVARGVLGDARRRDEQPEELEHQLERRRDVARRALRRLAVEVGDLGLAVLAGVVALRERQHLDHRLDASGARRESARAARGAPAVERAEPASVPSSARLQRSRRCQSR